jgi:hypothetical protein
MSKLHNRCFPIHFLSGIKICKMGTTIGRGFPYIQPMSFYPQCWWKRWGHYRPNLEENFSRFILTITWSILVRFAWPRGHFDCTWEGYKMICSKIHQTRRLPVLNPTCLCQLMVWNHPTTIMSNQCQVVFRCWGKLTSYPGPAPMTATFCMAIWSCMNQYLGCLWLDTRMHFDSKFCSCFESLNTIPVTEEQQEEI